MRPVSAMLAAIAGLLLMALPAQARLDVRVDIAAQRMSVTTSDGEAYSWAISSGRTGFRSPNGVYRPTRLEKNWYSRKYGGAMPHAIFFRGGYAIHGTTAVGALGRPASHGCIRLHPANAAKLFALVRKHGSGATRIALNGVAPDGLSRFAKAARPGQRGKAALRSEIAAGPAARPGVAERVGSPVLVRPAVVAARPSAAARPHPRPETARPAAVAREIASPMRLPHAGERLVARPATRQAGLAAEARAAERRAQAAHHRAIGWETARERVLLRPSLPAGAYGYQPHVGRTYYYYPPGYGWR